jgi:Bardet-Biedl syndrome 4 protein
MATVAREKQNWLIHLLYSRHEYDECLRVVEEVLRAAGGLCEYPLYVKGLIRRQQGRVAESLQFFQAACALGPRNPANLKQVGRSLFLLGRHAAALEAYCAADAAGGGEDRDLCHARGLCLLQLRKLVEAEEAFNQANSIARAEGTFVQLARLRLMQGDVAGAAEVYTEAVEHSPDSAELLTALGLLHARLGAGGAASTALKVAATLDPRSPATALALGSGLQAEGDAEGALLRYRVSAVGAPTSAPLWSNVGLAFWAKGKPVAALACLQRALLLDPFEWRIAVNAGRVFLASGLPASAFHVLSAAVHLAPSHAPAYGLLGDALAALGDGANAVAAYERALGLEPGGEGAALVRARLAEALAAGSRAP